MKFMILALLAVAGCRLGPGPDQPVEPGPPPEPAPGATACERACARADQVCPAKGGPLCVEACERYESLGPGFTRHPQCQAQAVDCSEIDRCRAE